MTEFDLIKKLTHFKCEKVAPFEIATTPEQWAELFPKEKIETEADMTNYYLSHLSDFKKTANKITFPECNLTENDLCNAIEELTRGFEKEKCRLLLETLTKHKTNLSVLCNEYKKIWNKPAPIEFVCSFLESNLTDEQPNTLPPCLNTNEAKKYFAKAMELGLMDKQYNWLKGKTLCACFAFGMNIKVLHLGKGKRKSWKPFEQLFGYENLRGNINDIKFHGQDLTDIDLLDGVFPDINLYAEIMDFS